jgi:osmotically-inducible protein OsmY
MTSIEKSDHQIQQDVMRELSWDARVDAASIGVAVDDGVVTLTGTVASWGEKHAAQQAAHHVAGVLDVANDIRIQQSWTTDNTDTALSRAVRSALQWNALVPDEKIQSTVEAGVVTLSGQVETLAEHDNAERAIRWLRGVRGIDNQIVVVPIPVAKDAIHAAIRAALERHIDREADRITVEVVGDTVELSGIVDSWAERKAVLGVAKGTRGVRAVSDHLHVG